MSAYIKRIESIKDSVDKLIDTLDNKGILGPIGYLEEAQENLDAAISEVEMYEESGE